jgi:hypothetical protein
MGGMPGTGVHEPEERAQDEHVHHDERQELRTQLQAESAKADIGVGVRTGHATSPPFPPSVVPAWLTPGLSGVIPAPA